MSSINEKIVRAIKENNVEQLKALLHGETVNDINSVTDSNNLSLLHVAAYEIEYIDIDIILFLLSLEINVNARDSLNLETPLITAIRMYQTESRILSMCELLLKNGSEINATDKNGNTALHEAVNRRLPSVELVKFLLNNDAHPRVMNVNNYYPFSIALEWRNEEIQELLFDYMGNFNDYFEEIDQFIGNESLLHIAIRNNSPFISKMLERGAKISQSWGLDSTYDYCLKYKRLDILKLIINSYTDPCFHEDSMLTRVLPNRTENTLEEHFSWEELIKIINTVVEPHVHKFVQSLMKYHDVDTFVKRLFSGNYDSTKASNLVYHLIEILLKNGYSPTILEFSKYFICRGYSKDTLYIIENVETNGWTLPVDLLYSFCTTDCKVMELFLQTGDHAPMSSEVRSKIGDIIYYLYNDNDTAAFPLLIKLDTSKMLSLSYYVPSLLDLARNSSRDYICSYYNVKTFKQFYGVLQRVDLNTDILNLLKYRQVLYDVDILQYKIVKY